MRISDWSSDVCSSDLAWPFLAIVGELFLGRAAMFSGIGEVAGIISGLLHHPGKKPSGRRMSSHERSEEHTSELQSLMRISYAVFCLKKKKFINNHRLKHG